MALLELGQVREARAALAPVQNEHLEDRRAADLVAIAAAKVAAAAGDGSSAVPRLRAVVAEDRKLGLVQNRLEAEMARADIEHRPDPQLVAEAARLGYGLIAKRARAANTAGQHA